MTEIKCIQPKYRRILLLSSNPKIQVTRNQSENGKSEHVIHVQHGWDAAQDAKSNSNGT